MNWLIMGFISITGVVAILSSVPTEHVGTVSAVVVATPILVLLILGKCLITHWMPLPSPPATEEGISKEEHEGQG